jgi:hypothetical protein
VADDHERTGDLVPTMYDVFGVVVDAGVGLV